MSGVATPTKRRVTLIVDAARSQTLFPHPVGDVIVALADDLAEARALLEDTERVTADYCEGVDDDEGPSDECMNDTPCHVHRIEAFLARTK